MAYAEKRGRKWRVKYKCADSREASRSGFETKASALNWGRDQEAAVRAGRWVDPGGGKLTVETWITRWLGLQDVGMSTQAKYEYLLRRFIHPRWGTCLLHLLSSVEISDWRTACPPGKASLGARLMKREACCARSSVTPPPAGRHSSPTTRRCDHVIVAAGPAAESTAGRHGPGPRLSKPCSSLNAPRYCLAPATTSSSSLQIAAPGCGRRSGRLERAHVHPQHINVEWQLREINGTFHRLPPKDDSYRSTDWEPMIPVYLPPFLARLLATHMSNRPLQRCTCAPTHGGSGHYIFASRAGAHECRSNYAHACSVPPPTAAVPHKQSIQANS